jgi:hypothetical protein
MTTAYVIDTSYLLELFRVPGDSNEPAIEEVTRRYVEAVNSRARLYVPIPCLFELANHIADVPDGNRRHRLANSLTQQVKAAVEDPEAEWVLVSGHKSQEVSSLWSEFARRYAQQGIGLTDTSTIEVARRLKDKTYQGNLHKVHIWTKDHALKSWEPDQEPDPFIG